MSVWGYCLVCLGGRDFGGRSIFDDDGDIRRSVCDGGELGIILDR